MAGAGSKGLPNGRPVDEWGIRMEDGSCNPAGASVARGGAANGPAAVYAIRKWDEWLRKYAPPGAASYDFYQSLPALSTGNVAQQISGTPRSRLQWSRPRAKATTPWTMTASRCGAWRRPARALLGRRSEARLSGCRVLDTLQVDPGRPPQGRLALCPVRRRQDRLAQETHVGLTPIRDSDIRHESFTERAPKLGGLVEFYRSPDRVRWSPTGVNVPDYPKLAQIWWQQIVT